jgi:hypothetical protein
MDTKRRSLANIANYHMKLKNYRKKYSHDFKTYTFKTVQEFENYESRLGKGKEVEVANEIETISLPSLNSKNIAGNTANTSPSSSPTASPPACTITPGGQKMKKVNGKWVPCVFGGKRKTRKGKKARRLTRRKR